MVREDSGPCGFHSVDELVSNPSPTLSHYVAAVSQYVRESRQRSASEKKKAQLRLSHGLAAVLDLELKARLPQLDTRVGETKIGGGLRNVNADLSEVSELDGVRLAVEIKPINLAVGRAIWNRFGDIRTFGTNVHLKFPFAVVAGVLTIPVYEETTGGKRKSTVHLIERAVDRLARAGDRRNEGDAPHLLEAIGVLVYDPDSKAVDATNPPAGLGLRWDEFVTRLAEAYESRFGAE